MSDVATLGRWAESRDGPIDGVKLCTLHPTPRRKKQAAQIAPVATHLITPSASSFACALSGNYRPAGDGSRALLASRARRCGTPVLLYRAERAVASRVPSAALPGLESRPRHGKDPLAYLREVLTRLPGMSNQDDLTPLLPENWRPRRQTRRRNHGTQSYRSNVGRALSALTCIEILCPVSFSESRMDAYAASNPKPPSPESLTRAPTRRRDSQAPPKPRPVMYG